MKINFLRTTGRPGLYLSLALAGLLFVNCSKDDDTPPSYDFEEQFADLDEMPALVIETPVFEEPDLGSVEASAATQNLIADLQAGGDISAETQASFDAMNNFTADLSANVKAEAQGLTAARIAELMDAESFDGDLAALVTKLGSMPAEVAVLLPAISFSNDFNLSQEVTTKEGLGADAKEDVMGAQQQGPCFTAANNAYDNALVEPLAQKAVQDAEITAFQAEEDGKAVARAQTRGNSISAAATTYKNEFAGNATDLLDLANTYDSTKPEWAATLRMYALVYTLQASTSITTWKDAALELVENRLGEELGKIQEIRTMLENQTNANFNAIQNAAQGILNSALNNCHNQGSSN